MVLKRNAILRKERDIFNKNIEDQNNNSNINSDILGPIQTVYQRPQIKETNRVTAEDIRQMREMEFSRVLQTKQSEFSNMINSNKPKEIDFSDKVDDERIGNNMEQLLEQVKMQREKELGITYTDQNIKSADEFIKKGPKEISNQKKLIIDKNENNILSDKIENNRKQVRFDENNNEQITFSIEDSILNENNYQDLEYNDNLKTSNNGNTNDNSSLSTSSFLTKLKTKKAPTLVTVNKELNNINVLENANLLKNSNLLNSTDSSQTNNEILDLRNEILLLKKINFDMFDQVKYLTTQVQELIHITKDNIK